MRMFTVVTLLPPLPMTPVRFGDADLKIIPREGEWIKVLVSKPDEEPTEELFTVSQVEHSISIQQLPNRGARKSQEYKVHKITIHLKY